MSDLTVALTLTADGKQLIGTLNQSRQVVSNLKYANGEPQYNSAAARPRVLCLRQLYLGGGFHNKQRGRQAIPAAH